MKTKIILILCVFLSSAQAQTLLNESFNYGGTAGPLCGSGGVSTVWTPHLNAGTIPINYATPSLSYVGYSTGASITNGAISFANGVTPRENINHILPLSNSGSVYVSFLLKVSGATSATLSSDYVVHFNDTFGSNIGTNSIGRIFIKNQIILPYSNIGLTKGSIASSAVYSTVNYTVNSTVLVVMKYKFNTGSLTDDSVYAWIFTSGVPATEPAPQLIAADMSVPDLAQIRSLCIRQGTIGTSYGNIDAIKVGTSWANTVLPVKWLDFSGKQVDEDKSVLLNWSTASEINNHGFEVERCLNNCYLNEDAKWETIGGVDAVGNTNQVSKYQFHDVISVLPLTQTEIHYRIKQVDNDGRFSYSRIICVSLKSKKDLSPVIFPNPFENEVSIQTNENETIVRVIDLLGNVKLYRSDSEKLSINTASFSPGVYFVEFESKSGRMYARMIKQ